MATQDKNAISPEDLKLSQNLEITPLNTATVFETTDGISYDVSASKWVYDRYKKSRVNIGVFEDLNTGRAAMFEFVGGKMVIEPHELEKYRFMKLHPTCEGSPFASENRGEVKWREVDVRLKQLYDARESELVFVADSTLRALGLPDLKRYLRSFGVNPETNTTIHALQQKAKTYIKSNLAGFVDEYSQDERHKLFAKVVLAHQINVLKYYQGQWSVEAELIVVCPEAEYADQVLVDFLTKEVMTDNEKVLVQKVFDKIHYKNPNPFVTEKAPELPLEKPKK